MFEPSTRDFRFFSDLAYSNLLSKHFAEQGRKKLIDYQGNSNGFIKKFNNDLNLTKLFNEWELVNTHQNIVTNANVANPLLDAFVFKKCCDSSYVIAFRGTNIKNVAQFCEDMKQNKDVLLINRKEDTQLGQAEALTKLFIKQHFNYDFKNPSEYPLDKCVDLSKNIYVTGHSKGGGLAQAVVCILREEYGFKIKGVTFSATPIYFLPFQLTDPSMDWECKNFLLFSDRILGSLAEYRFFILLKQLKNQVKDLGPLSPISTIKIDNLLKLRSLSTSLIPQYVGGIERTYKPQPGPLQHSLSHYDKYFNESGDLF